MPRLASTPLVRPPTRLRMWLSHCAAAFLVLLACAAIAHAAAPTRQDVVVIPVVGAISPASADFITRSLTRAANTGAQLAVIELDTPGGLDVSMRQIIKAILASPIPVAAFIAPGGARAASAGTYIVYASHIAAMAPGTNLGAATPIQLGAPGLAAPEPKRPSEAGKGAASAPATETQSTETRKQIDDAAAYIRGLAQLRGRNAAWAEQAVREAVSLSASEALAQHVVDLTARDLPDLLTKLDGRIVETATGPHKLATSHAQVVTFEPDWRSHFLAVVTDPNVALILLTIGMYGLFFEFANPGFVLPGVAGAICLLVGLFALQLLPISYTGLALIFLGIAFLIAEAFLPTFGTLGFGGIVAFAAGALMLIDTDQPGYGVPLPTVAAISAAGAVFVFFVSSFAYRARRRPVVTGGEALVGSVGEVIDAALAPADEESTGASVGWARVHGERWRVRAAAPLAAGAHIRVTGRHGLVLDVVSTEEPQQRGVSP
ncbi:NfeD family protein [Trinickia sp. NRRL B-1857]|uniref:NfeD family protein n=1 Tax=Trinickia sp. NRRL B-1857 TaxID=3162879 RepID=UPI003D2B61BF